jgi:hypothetical protein
MRSVAENLPELPGRSAPFPAANMPGFPFGKSWGRDQEGPPGMINDLKNLFECEMEPIADTTRQENELRPFTGWGHGTFPGESGCAPGPTNCKDCQLIEGRSRG